MASQAVEAVRADFIDRLPPAAARRLLETAQSVSYPAGAALITPGAPARPGILTAGRLRGYLPERDGRQVTLGYREVGQAFGLTRCFVPDFPVLIGALTPVTVTHFAPQVLLHLMREDAAVAIAVAEFLADRVDAECRNARALAFGNARRRIADHLLQLGQRDQQGRLVARVTHQQLADAAGTVREHAARLLNEMRRQGLLSTRRGSIIVEDERELRRLSTSNVTQVTLQRDKRY